MFLRSIKAPNGRHEYLRLVESYREGDKVKQRIVAHLGRKDLLAPHLDTLIRLLQEESSFPRWVPLEQISTPRASTWGPILVARHLFDKLSLGSILDAGQAPLLDTTGAAGGRASRHPARSRSAMRSVCITSI